MNANNTSSQKLSKFQKIPATYAGIVLPFILSVIMTLVVSLISTLRSIGFTEGLLHIWMSAWALSWVIAFPTLLIVLPVVKKTTQVIVKPW